MSPAVAWIVAFSITPRGPEVYVRWSHELGDTGRAAVERELGLVRGRLADARTWRDQLLDLNDRTLTRSSPGDARTWRYQLLNPTEGELHRLVAHPLVEDTAGFDRAHPEPLGPAPDLAPRTMLATLLFWLLIPLLRFLRHLMPPKDAPDGTPREHPAVVSTANSRRATTMNGRLEPWRGYWRELQSSVALLVVIFLVSFFYLFDSLAAPRITVRWEANLPEAERLRLEGQLSLEDGKFHGGRTWTYSLEDPTRERVRRLVENGSVEDTHSVRRRLDETDSPAVAAVKSLVISLLSTLFIVSMRFLVTRYDWVRGRAAGPPLVLFAQVGFAAIAAALIADLPLAQSVSCLTLGVALLFTARVASPRFRAWLTLGFLAALTVAIIAVPITVPIEMGDFATFTQSRDVFEQYTGSEIRFSSHLSFLLLRIIDRALGAGEHSPGQAFLVLSWLAGIGFAISAAALAALNRWSPRAIRYVALSVSAPATLMFFGYRELGYLSLSVVAFPLVARGLQKTESDLSPALMVGAGLFGLGAALHGVGLIGIAGMVLAILVSDQSWRRKLKLASVALSLSLTAYLGWVLYYMIVLQEGVIPFHSGDAIWRPLFTAGWALQRNVLPLLSYEGIRAVFLSGWVAGLPVLFVVVRGWRRAQTETRLALAFTLPSLLFFVFFWPDQGIGLEMDFLVAAFPAIYALLWLCSLSGKETAMASCMLAAGHWVFWSVVLDPRRFW